MPYPTLYLTLHVVLHFTLSTRHIMLGAVTRTTSASSLVEAQGKGGSGFRLSLVLLVPEYTLYFPQTFPSMSLSTFGMVLGWGCGLWRCVGLLYIFSCDKSQIGVVMGEEVLASLPSHSHTFSFPVFIQQHRDKQNTSERTCKLWDGLALFPILSRYT